MPPGILCLKSLYKQNDSNKLKIIQEVLENFLKNMDENRVLEPEDKEEQDPTVYMWLLAYIAQHHYYYNDIEKALSYIDRAIQHTPTVLELVLLKAKFYKRGGNIEYASKLAVEGSYLDKADRYPNVVSSRYLIKADKCKEAEEHMVPFSREGEELNTHDMQT